MSKKKNLMGMFGGSEPVVEEKAPEVKAEPVAEAPKAEVKVEEPVGVTYLAKGTVLEGKLSAKGDVEIDGVVNGDVTAKGKVVIRSEVTGNVTAASMQLVGGKVTGDVRATESVVLSSNTVVTGNIYAGDLLCSGSIKGDVDVQGNMALDTNAIVEGDISTATMTMAQGAVISGAVTMKNKK